MKIFLTILLLAFPLLGFAEPGLPLVVVQDAAGGGKSYSLTLQILALMTVLTLLPSLLLMMTSFTRIIVVLSILRQALGTAQNPVESGAGGFVIIFNLIHYGAGV